MTDPLSPARPGWRRRLWRIARWPLALVATAAVLLIAINVVDEDLAADTRAMLEPPANPLADGDNLYVLLAGIDAPAGESPVQRGQQNIAKFLAALAAREPGQMLPPERGRTPDDVQWRPRLGRDAWRAEASIWDGARAEAGRVDELSAQYRGLLERYATLHAAAGYHETLPPDPQTPFYTAGSDLRALYLGSLARQVQAGSPAVRDAALRSLSEDIRLWHRMLQGEGALVSKMVALGYLQADYRLLSDMVADPAVPVSLFANHAGLFEVVPLDDWKIGKVFASEFRFQAEILRPEQGVVNRLNRVFFQQNGSLNLFARNMRRIQAIADGDPAAFREQDLHDAARQASFPGVLRNPVGKILAQIGMPAYQSYIERAWDAAALQRATVLAWRVRAEAVPEDAVAAFISAHPDLGIHPVGNGSLEWDADAGELRVPFRSAGNQHRPATIRVLPAQILAASQL